LDSLTPSSNALCSVGLGRGANLKVFNSKL
jgi:hypothetical protein